MDHEIHLFKELNLIQKAMTYKTNKQMLGPYEFA
jgi:hypothetical protein